MAEAVHTHKILTIKCCIDSYASTIKKNPININVKGGSNDDYLANMIAKIRKKFKFLANLDDSEWSMQIGDDIADKENGERLQEILQRIPPIPVIQIVKTQISQDQYVITVHFGDQQFDYPLTSNPEDWDEVIYQDLVQTIRTKFNLQSEFALFEDFGGSHVDIEAMDDISESFDAINSTKGIKVLHLFVETEPENTNRFKIDATKDESDEMKLWFDKTVKLPQYYQLFIEAGYEDMSYLDETIEDRDLMEDVGITVQSHRETILNAIKSLLQPHARPETDDQLNEPVVLTDELKGNESENDEEDVSPIVNIVHVLVDLGSIIGTFTDSKKKSCHGTLANILYEIKLAKEQKAVGIKEQEQEVKAEEDSKDDEEDEDGKRDMELKEDDVLQGVPTLKRAKSTLGMEIASTLKTILEPISKTESAKFIDCIVSFLQIIGFEANHVQNKGFEITGASDQKTLDEVERNFYHLSNAMQKPKMNVYQQLNIHIPNDGSVVKHKSGLYDNEFITFLLPQIVMENQQSSLVNKVTLDPEHLERFINFLVPNSSKYLCREIYFEKLIPLKVSAIGLFGSRKEVLCMLMKYKSISKALYDKLIDDETNAVLSPGIHGIVPVNLQQDTHMDDWDRVIYLFYWSLPSSFDMVKMKGVKNMRRDPACLLSRVLYEISSTVAIMVSSSELHDFGVVKHSGKKIKKQKRTIRRVKLVIEETKENHIMCLNQTTPQKEILTFSDVHNSTASDLFLFGGPCLTGWCQLYPQKERVTQKRIRWDGSTKEELTNKIKALNTKYMIELDYDLPLPAQGIVIQSLMPDQYADYKQTIDRLKVEEDEETAYDKIKQEAESIIAARNAEILQGFFNQYNTKQNCQEHHSAMCAIMQELGNDIEADIATAAVTYASME
eukprot:359054_1